MRRVDVAELQRHGLVDVAVVAVVVDARLGDARGCRPGEAKVRSGSYSTSIRSTASVGGGLVARDDGRHRIADEADLVAAQRVLVVADRQDAVGDREGLAGEHQVDAVDLRGLATCRR